MKRAMMYVAMVAVLFAWGTASWGVTINEDFSSDPGWSKTPSNLTAFGYNSTQQAIAEAGNSANPGQFDFVTPTRRYYKPLGTVITQDNDFTFSADIVVTGQSATGACIFPGLFESAKGNMTGGICVQVFTSGSTRLMVNYDGGILYTTGWGVYVTGNLYTYQVSYSASTRIFTYIMRTGGTQVYSATVALPAGATFAKDLFGVGNRDSGVSAVWLKGVIDNMYLTDYQLDPAAMPVLSPEPGTYTTAQTVTITCATPNATIRYTTDGTDPAADNTTGTVYSDPISVNQSMTIKARAFADGLSASAVRSGVYSIAAAMPTISPNGGKLGAAKDVIIDCETSGATIRYTTDGTDPAADNTTGTIYSGPISVSSDTTIKARAFADGLSASAVKSVTFTFPTTYNRPENIYSTSSITVDGNLSDWADAQWAPLDQSYNANPTIDLDNALSCYAAKWSADGSKIYIAAKIKDTAHKFLDSYDTWWKRDAIEIYIYMGRAVGYYATNQDTAQEYSVGITNSDRATVWTAIGGLGQAVPASAEFEAAGREGTGSESQWLYYEAAITPFDYYGGLISQPSIFTGLSEDVVIGLDVCAVGNDGTGEEYIPTRPGYTGMLAENMLTGKSGDYNKFGLHKLTVATPALHAGDANGDGMVDVGDLGILAANYGGSGKTWALGDFNNDGLVDVGDLGILAANYGFGVNAALDFNADYAKAFGTAVEEDDSANDSSICSGLGLPLIAGLFLAALALMVRQEE